MTQNAPKDELVPPEWMNKHFFQKVLIETNKDDSLKVRFTKSTSL